METEKEDSPPSNERVVFSFKDKQRMKSNKNNKKNQTQNNNNNSEGSTSPTNSTLSGNNNNNNNNVIFSQDTVSGVHQSREDFLRARRQKSSNNNNPNSSQNSPTTPKLENNNNNNNNNQNEEEAVRLQSAPNSPPPPPVFVEQDCVEGSTGGPPALYSGNDSYSTSEVPYYEHSRNTSDGLPWSGVQYIHSEEEVSAGRVVLPPIGVDLNLIQQAKYNPQQQLPFGNKHRSVSEATSGVNTARYEDGTLAGSGTLRTNNSSFKSIFEKKKKDKKNNANRAHDASNSSSTTPRDNPHHHNNNHKPTEEDGIVRSAIQLKTSRDDDSDRGDSSSSEVETPMAYTHTARGLGELYSNANTVHPAEGGRPPQTERARTQLRAPLTSRVEVPRRFSNNVEHILSLSDEEEQHHTSQGKPVKRKSSPMLMPLPGYGYPKPNPHSNNNNNNNSMSKRNKRNKMLHRGSLVSFASTARGLDQTGTFNNNNNNSILDAIEQLRRQSTYSKKSGDSHVLSEEDKEKSRLFSGTMEASDKDLYDMTVNSGMEMSGLNATNNNNNPLMLPMINPATQDRRKSTFSSLQFSMTGRHQPWKKLNFNNNNTNKTNQNTNAAGNNEDAADIFSKLVSPNSTVIHEKNDGDTLEDDNDSNKENQGSIEDNNKEDNEETTRAGKNGRPLSEEEDEDDLLKFYEYYANRDNSRSSRGGIGLWETPEYILLPHYQIFEDGETLQEKSIRFVSQSLANSPAASPYHSPQRPPPLGEDSENPPPLHLNDKRSHTSNVLSSPSLSQSLSASPGTKSLGNNNNNLHYFKKPHKNIYSFGVVSSKYDNDPEVDEEGVLLTHSATPLSPASGYMDPLTLHLDSNTGGVTHTKVDCKIGARLLFDADKGVMMLVPKDEAGKYVTRPTELINSEGEEEEDDGACDCCEAYIHSFLHMDDEEKTPRDFSQFHAHTLFQSCQVCQRSPSSFLCLHCLQSVCPSHVSAHYHGHHAEEDEDHSKCTLFLNFLDIMTDFTRIFWCEKCGVFTYKYTEVYDTLVDRLAYTRGTYLPSASRDMHCLGWELVLRREGNTSSPTRFSTSRRTTVDLVSADVSSTMNAPLPSGEERRVSGESGGRESSGGPPLLEPALLHESQSNSVREALASSPMHHYLERDCSPHNVVAVGEAVSRLSAIGVSVQGWRATQEDAEAAFMVNIPALGEKKEDEEGETPTIPMAVFCVFDGHGGDAVAKIAASTFEAHLQRAISRTHPNDIKARALLFHLTTESTLRRTVSNAASEQFNRSNRVDSPSSPLTDFSQQPTSLSLADLRVGDTQKGDETLLSAKQLLSGQPEREAFLRSWEGDADPDETGNPNPNNNNASGNALLAVPSGSLQNNNNTSSHSVLVPEHSSPARSEEAQRLSQAAVLVSTPEVEMLRLYFSNIMQDALHSLDDYLRHTEEGERGDYNCTGCTACVVGITSNFILCANVGDSGAAVYTPQQIDPISLKHRLSDPREQQRITGAGYAVVNDRIEGLLAVPRALGDFDFKQCGGKSVEEQAVTCTPDVTVRPVPVDSRWGVILACDGVWDTATVHQIHYALTHTQSDLDVAGSATEAVLRAKELYRHRRRGPLAYLHSDDESESEGEGSVVAESDLGGDPVAAGVGLDAPLLTAAAGVLAQCVAPRDNEGGIGLDNCSLILVERRGVA